MRNKLYIKLVATATSLSTGDPHLIHDSTAHPSP